MFGRSSVDVGRSAQPADLGLVGHQLAQQRGQRAHVDDHRYVRVVLRPSQRAIPFYERLGFRPDEGLIVRHGKP